jgi:hypothetical protein
MGYRLYDSTYKIVLHIKTPFGISVTVFHIKTVLGYHYQFPHKDSIGVSVRVPIKVVYMRFKQQF